MSDPTFTTPALIVLLIPTTLFPLVMMLFLRTQRHRPDYSVTRWLFVFGTLVWLAIACWEAFDLSRLPLAMDAPFEVRDILAADTYNATVPRWILLCLPAFTTFFAVLVMFRKRFHV